ncbi:MAG: hypothetical protein Alis3KO_38710 [Aliiglaciecola sp.]
MTNELLDMQQSIAKQACEAVLMERELMQSQQRARQDESFNQLLSRMDRLRKMSQQRRGKQSYVKKVQTSFMF